MKIRSPTPELLNQIFREWNLYICHFHELTQGILFYFILFIYLFIIIIIIIIICLHWVFIAALGLSPVAASGGYTSLWCAGFSLQWALLLRVRGSRSSGVSSCSMRAQQLWHAGPRACRLQQLWCAGCVVVACRLQSTGSVVVAHGPSCSAACGILPGQGQNLHWQTDSQLLLRP